VQSRARAEFPQGYRLIIVLSWKNDGPSSDLIADRCSDKKGECMRQNSRQRESGQEHDRGQVGVKLTTYGYRFAAAGLAILLLTALMANRLIEIARPL
jgi:hypothetical protein